MHEDERHDPKDGKVAVYSRAKAERKDYMTYKYTIDDVKEIYLSKAPLSIFRNDGVPIVYRMVPGDRLSDLKGDTEEEERITIVQSIDPRSLFSNVERGKDLQISAVIGTYHDGTFQASNPEDDSMTRSIDWMNDRIDSFENDNKAETSSHEDIVDTKGVNKDCLEVSPVDRPKSKRKFVFKDGRLVSLE